MAVLKLDVTIVTTLLAVLCWFAPAFPPSNAAQAACVIGSDNCPIRIHLRPGADRVTVRGRLTPNNQSCCSYAFKARAGQRLTWTFDGPTIRTLIRYPTGESDGPGLPDVIPLPSTGTYVFTVSSNSMAEDTFGPFRLTLRINCGTGARSVPVRQRLPVDPQPGFHEPHIR